MSLEVLRDPFIIFIIGFIVVLCSLTLYIVFILSPETEAIVTQLKQMSCNEIKEHILNNDYFGLSKEYVKDQYLWRCIYK